MATKYPICKRCGRRLKNSLFIKLGYGKKCYTLMCIEKTHYKKLFDERMVITGGKNTGKKIG